MNGGLDEDGEEESDEEAEAESENSGVRSGSSSLVDWSGVRASVGDDDGSHDGADTVTPLLRWVFASSGVEESISGASGEGDVEGNGLRSEGCSVEVGGSSSDESVVGVVGVEISPSRRSGGVGPSPDTDVGDGDIVLAGSLEGDSDGRAGSAVENGGFRENRSSGVNGNGGVESVDGGDCCSGGDVSGEKLSDNIGVEPVLHNGIVGEEVDGDDDDGSGAGDVVSEIFRVPASA